MTSTPLCRKSLFTPFSSKYGFTAQSLPVLVHGVQSMQNLKPAKEFRTLIANEESLDARLEIKGHLEYYLAVFALGLEGPKWWRLVCDYMDRCDDEHSSLQEKFIHTFFKQYGFTAQSLPVLVHGVPVHAESGARKGVLRLDRQQGESGCSSWKSKGNWNITCRKNPAATKGRWTTFGGMCSGQFGAKDSENGGTQGHQGGAEGTERGNTSRYLRKENAMKKRTVKDFVALYAPEDEEKLVLIQDGISADKTFLDTFWTAHTHALAMAAVQTGQVISGRCYLSWPLTDNERENGGLFQAVFQRPDLPNQSSCLERRRPQ